MSRRLHAIESPGRPWRIGRFVIFVLGLIPIIIREKLQHPGRCAAFGAFGRSFCCESFHNASALHTFPFTAGNPVLYRRHDLSLLGTTCGRHRTRAGVSARRHNRSAGATCISRYPKSHQDRLRSDQRDQQKRAQFGGSRNEVGIIHYCNTSLPVVNFREWASPEQALFDSAAALWHTLPASEKETTANRKSNRQTEIQRASAGASEASTGPANGPGSRTAQCKMLSAKARRVACFAPASRLSRNRHRYPGERGCLRRILFRCGTRCVAAPRLRGVRCA